MVKSDKVQKALISQSFPDSYGATVGCLLTLKSLEDDLFIHVDLFVFPPLAVHNKGEGGGISNSPAVRK